VFRQRTLTSALSAIVAMASVGVGSVGVATMGSVGVAAVGVGAMGSVGDKLRWSSGGQICLR
jgi:hypothetical protein